MHAIAVGGFSGAWGADDKLRELGGGDVGSGGDAYLCERHDGREVRCSGVGLGAGGVCLDVNAEILFTGCHL